MSAEIATIEKVEAAVHELHRSGQRATADAGPRDRAHWRRFEAHRAQAHAGVAGRAPAKVPRASEQAC